MQTERQIHVSCKKRTVIPPYPAFLQAAVNVDVPEGTHATLPNGITTVLLIGCLLTSI